MTFTQGAGVASSCAGAMTYSRPSGENPPMPLKRVELRGIDSGLRGSQRPMRARRRKPRDPRLGRRTAVDLLGQRSAAIDDDRAGDRLEEHAILVRDLLRMPNENAARPIDDVRFDAGGDQPDDLLLQPLPIAVVILVPDHEIDGEALEPPVGVRLHELAHQLDIGGIGDLQQHDRQIAGDGVAPQARIVRDGSGPARSTAARSDALA